MYKVSRVPTAPALALVTVFLLSPLAPAVAGAVYQPGVLPGDWAKYQVSATWTPGVLGIPPPPQISDFLNTDWVKTNVTAVSGQEVIASQTWSFTNGSGTREVTLDGNVETWEGNLTLWIISSGLNEMDGIYNDATAPTLNATITKTVLWSTRAVNVLNVTTTLKPADLGGGTVLVEATLFWDKPTGVLLELDAAARLTSPFSYMLGSTHVVIADTNLWPTPDFGIGATPGWLTIASGHTAMSTISLESLNGFAGIIQLSAVSPDGLSASLDPVVSVEAGQTVTSIMSVDVEASVPAGDYSIVITAKQGTLSRSETVTVNVTAVEVVRTPTILGVEPVIFYAIIAVVAVTVVLLIVFTFSRVRASLQPQM